MPIHDTAAGDPPRRKNAVRSDVGNVINLSPTALPAEGRAYANLAGD